MSFRGSFFWNMCVGGLFALCLLWPAHVYAQSETTAPAQSSARPEHISAPATALSGETLLTRNFILKLWGIESLDIAGTALKIRARSHLDDLIRNQPVRCEIVAWKDRQPTARCVNSAGDDLGMSLLREGFAVVNRPEVIGSAFEDAYFRAEESGKRLSRGAWYIHSTAASPQPTSFARNDLLVFSLLIGILLSPLIGAVLVSNVNTKGFQDLAHLQATQMKTLIDREESMRQREKYVLAAMLDSEISSNRSKLDAFLVVYQDTLKNLRDPDKIQKYRQTGEIIQQRPVLSRSVFDSKIDKMDLLESQLAADITELYTMISATADYLTLEPDTPIEEAIYHVTNVVHSAQELVDPIEKILASLAVVLRDKKDRAHVSGQTPPRFAQKPPFIPPKR